MRFYNQQHKHYCGIDLHARKMYVCILNAKGKVVVHQNIKTDPEAFFELIFPYIDDIAVGVECVFCWYWLADLCAEHHIKFVLEVKSSAIASLPFTAASTITLNKFSF